MYIYLFLIIMLTILPLAGNEQVVPARITNRSNTNVKVNNNFIQGLMPQYRQVPLLLQEHKQVPFHNNTDSSDTMPDVKQVLNTFGRFCKNHKLGLALGSVGALYGFIWFKLLASNTIFGQKDTWLMWKSDIPLIVLQEVSQQKVVAELFAAIQEKYSIVHPNDVMHSLLCFKNDLEKELAYYKQGISLHNWLHYLKIAVLFPKQKDLLMQTYEKIKRLEYLQDLFESNLVHYAVNQNQNDSTYA